MDAIELLHNRVSAPTLLAPAPTSEQLDIMFRAALRSPDHAGLKPWRFLIVEGDAREALGELYVKAAKVQDSDLPEAKEAKLRKMPQRAPMIVVASACIQEHPKVPEVEQVITAGCAAHNLIQAAYAQGIGAMWRTGDMIFDPVVKAGLGLQPHEQIIGFIYLGTTRCFKAVPASSWQEQVSHWQES